VHGTIESVLSVELRPLSDLAAIAAELRELCACALEPNVFYEPAFAIAAQPVFAPDGLAGLVWCRSESLRLVGFFPVRIERRRYGLPMPVLLGWTHPFAPLGTPLIARGLGEPVVEAWFLHPEGQGDLPKVVLIPYLPAEGAIAQALDRTLVRRGGSNAAFGKHARALLLPAAERADYLDRAIGKKKRRELRRQRKRLAEGGVVIASSTGEPAAIAHALDDFLTLEASGWKGRAGSAARASAEIHQFMKSAVNGLAAEGKAAIDRLFVDTRAIAAIVRLRSGAMAWCWKIAYDENFARASPGVQVLLDATEAVLADPAIARADSCATADHPMIDHIWRERLPLADRLIRIGPDRAWAFKMACLLESVRRSALTIAKSLRRRVQRSRREPN